MRTLTKIGKSDKTRKPLKAKEGLLASEESATCRKRDREGSCRRLLDAGLEIFSKYGYDAATTKLVAKEAGINESLINRYFEGKEGLLRELIHQFFESEKASGAFQYPAGKTVEQELLNFSIAMFDHLAKVNKFFKVVISRAIVDPKIADDMKCRADDGIVGLLAVRLMSFQKAGAIRADVDVGRASALVKNTCFSTGFLGHFVMGLDIDYVRATLAEFARDYALGISAKRAR